MKNSTGFTLIELMVAIAIVAIVSSLAFPSMSSFYTNNRLTAIVNDLLVGLNFTRAESIKRNLPVTICASANGSSCASDWSAGWIIFVDRNADGVVDSPTVLPDEIIQKKDSLDSSYTIKSNLNNSGGSAVSHVNYAINGFANVVGKYAVCFNNVSSNAKILSVTLTRSKISTSTETSITSCSNP